MLAVGPLDLVEQSLVSLEYVIGGHRLELREIIGPSEPRLGPDLEFRQHRRGIVERGDCRMDHLIGGPIVVEWRAAIAAKAAFHLERALEHGRTATRPFDRALLHGEACEEWSADRLLAHSAVTDADLVRRFANDIANRTALTATG